MKNGSTRLDDTLNGLLIATAISITLLMNLGWFQDLLDPPSNASTAATMAQATLTQQTTTVAPATHTPRTTTSPNHSGVSAHVPPLTLH